MAGVVSRIHPRSSLDEPTEEGEPDGHISEENKKKKKKSLSRVNLRTTEQQRRELLRTRSRQQRVKAIQSALQVER